MRWCYSVFICFFVLLVSFQTQATEPQSERDGIHIVYMGASTSSNGNRRNDLYPLLSSLRRRKNSVIHTYNKGFTGFAARLSEAEVHSIAQRPGVLSVFPDPILHLHTTRSWDFLEHLTDVQQTDYGPSQDTSQSGVDTIVGFLDTGIWPESKSFDDKGMGPIPSRWKGKCMTSSDFTSSSCNRKLIGARYYVDPDNPDAPVSPRDELGHGTHVAAIAAGTPVPRASYHGLAQGTAKGGSPGSRIAMYRVCYTNMCRGSAILKAFDDAIHDGVDVLSISLGASSKNRPAFFSKDPIAIGAFHAVEKGITVVCSAGNDGPDPATAINIAPWILTVAATTIDRQFETDIVLGGNKVIKGGSIQFSKLQRSPVYPLIYGGLAGHGSGGGIDVSASNCEPGSLDHDKVEARIIVCDNYDTDKQSSGEKLLNIIDLDGIGMILIDDHQTTVSSTYGSFPMATVTRNDGATILNYTHSTSKSMATILPTRLSNYKPAPAVAYFSGRGPAFNNVNILKPDVSAPGVDILAAWPTNDTKNAETPTFNIISGTSMSCPHVSGIAARVKSHHPTWSPSAIRSAIMTTAIQRNNMKASITAESGQAATPFDFGTGEVTLLGPLEPGLVYETENTGYLQFMCNMGYNISTIKLIAASIPYDFSCPSHSSKDLISNMNYPSISISSIKQLKSKKVTRSVTNVGEAESTYTVIVEAPKELKVQVIPKKLQFTKGKKKLSYEVTFTLTQSSAEDYIFGSITWTNNKYKVRSPFVVTSSHCNYTDPKCDSTSFI